MMRIFVDENIPMMTVNTLRAMGHEVIDIRGTEDEGEDDDILWSSVQEHQALLITTDKGFRKHGFGLHYGVLIIRLRQPNRSKIHQRVMDMMNRFKPDEWSGLIVVAQDSVHRISHSSKMN